MFSEKVKANSVSKSALAKPLLMALSFALFVVTLSVIATPSYANNDKNIDQEAIIVATRRVTESQFKNSVAAIFGDQIEINGRFEPEQREALLLAIGSSQLSISAAGFNQYFAIARSVSNHVTKEENRALYLSCVPKSTTSQDDACAKEILSHYGRLLFRRPLQDNEVLPRVQLAAQGAQSSHDFYRGIELALISLLSAPEFLFRIEMAETVPDKNDQYRLDSYTKAARLSHLFWDSSPDEELLQAAEQGELHNSKGVEKQIKRLLASPRLEAGTRAFFSDMLHLDRYSTLVKDAEIFPKFSQAVSNSAKEQTLKTVVNHLLEKDGDYRELLTTKETFMNRPLAAIYRVPFLAEDGWTKFTFPDDSQQSGLLTQISLAAVFSHPGRSSPTLRGVGINEIFLCNPTPTPPANVDFSIINDTNNQRLKTSRLRLEAHAEDPACSGCHRLIDPLGMALEHFDAMAQPRLYENGELIDVKANFLGTEFEGSLGLGKVLYESQQVQACLVRNVYAYGIGREPSTREKNSYLKEQTTNFAEKGYRFKELLSAIASSEKFFEAPNEKIDTVLNTIEESKLNNSEQIAGEL